jgi:hypothetical protein
MTLDVRLSVAHRAFFAPLTTMELRLRPAQRRFEHARHGDVHRGNAAAEGPRGLLAERAHGSAVVAVPLGDETITEHVAMTIVMAPAVEEQRGCTLVEVLSDTRDA